MSTLVTGPQRGPDKAAVGGDRRIGRPSRSASSHLTGARPSAAAWLVIAALCVLLYRLPLFMPLYIAEKVLRVDPGRQTPAYRHKRRPRLCADQPLRAVRPSFRCHCRLRVPSSDRCSPAQMGYLPGTLWILTGVVFARAVQDMTVLFLSTRRGRALARRT